MTGGGNRKPGEGAKARTASGAVPLGPDETARWVRTYARHSRVYAWGFFVLVLPFIFGLIWWEMGEVSDEVLHAFGFAALVFFLLARWSRSATTRSWKGRVEEMFMKQMRLRRDGGQPDGIAFQPMARVRTTGGKTLTLRLTAALYDYFSAGDRVFKLSGLEWPEKTDLDRPERVCLACGNLYDRDAGRCLRCGAPEPDHETLIRLTGPD